MLYMLDITNIVGGMMVSGNQLQDTSGEDRICPWVAKIIEPVKVAEVTTELWHLAINRKTPVAKMEYPLGWPRL